MKFHPMLDMDNKALADAFLKVIMMKKGSKKEFTESIPVNLLISINLLKDVNCTNNDEKTGYIGGWMEALVMISAYLHSAFEVGHIQNVELKTMDDLIHEIINSTITDSKKEGE